VKPTTQIIVQKQQQVIDILSQIQIMEQLEYEVKQTQLQMEPKQQQKNSVVLIEPLPHKMEQNKN
jgi:hypothetical protein